MGGGGGGEEIGSIPGRVTHMPNEAAKTKSQPDQNVGNSPGKKNGTLL